MPQIMPDDIRSIDDFDTLLDFLREKLDWPIPEGVELDEIVFPWSPEDLDLDEPIPRKDHGLLAAAAVPNRSNGTRLV